MNIVVKALSLEISGREILHQISIEIPDHSFTCLIGRNGSGKSTLLRAIAGDITEYSGMISEVKTDELSYLPQRLTPPPFLSVFETVHTGFYSTNIDKQEKLSAVNELLEQCGIYHVRNKNFSDISTGEQQRAWLAFALAQSKDLVLMDEPLSSIDLGSREHFYRLLREASRQGKTCFVVTHDVDMAVRYSDSIVLIEDGKKIFQGDPSSFQRYNK